MVLSQDALSHYDENLCEDEGGFCGYLGCEGHTGKLFWYTENSINFRIEIYATKTEIEWFIFSFYFIYFGNRLKNDC